MKFYAEGEGEFKEFADLIEDDFGTVWKRFKSPKGNDYPIFCMNCRAISDLGWKECNGTQLIVWCTDCLMKGERGETLDCS